MRPQRTDELLDLLLRTRLLDAAALRRLGDAWPAGDDPAPHVQELVRAGLLTRYQGDRLLAGRLSGLRLGPYRILDKLGRGGMGQVYKAEHLLLRRLVALKVLGKRRKASPSSKATPRVRTGRTTQLRREVETVGGLSHPNIVAAHDARRMRGRLVLVLEYVDGIDLERLLGETGPMPVALAVEATRQAALALQHMHEQKLVHRDVKPANLLLTHALSGGTVVKLLDLGLACPVSEAGRELCGTPDYIAPERGESPAATDIRGDVYSLGCTMYQLLAGRVPFPGGGWTGKLLRHCVEEPEPLAGVPEAVAEVVRRMMARDPAQRFQTPAEVVDAIDALRVGQASSLPVEPVASRMLALRRKRLALAALCVVAVALGTGAGNAARKGLALSIPSAPTPPRPAPPAEAPPSNLATRIESAKDGDILDIPTGRHLIPPIHLHGRRLTLRGAPGPRPVLVRAHQHTWDSLIQSDRDLTLEHLDLEAGDANGPPAPLVSVESATLTLRDCALTQRSAAPALTLRRGPLLLLERCRITALEQTLAVEAPSSADGRVSLRECDLHVRDSNGAAILLWGTDAAPSRPLAVELVASKLRAGRLVACRSLASLVDLSADDNQLIFHHALVCLHGCRDRLRWRGQRNRCESSGPWAWLDGRPQAARDEAAFAALWSSSR